MARGRKPAAATQAANLINALAFIQVAATRDGVIGWAAKHIRMSGNYAIAYDGQIAAGHPIAEELTLCPQGDQLRKALAKTGKTLVITETPAGRLSIKGEKLNALVPCVTPDTLPSIGPDPRLAPADDRIKAAFKCCGTLATENATRLIEASLLLRANDCTGSNGAAILQFWHGIDLPPNMVLPKIFCGAVAATKQPIEAFGASSDQSGRCVSVTFFFEGGAWLKTVCYADDWPNIENLWREGYYQPVAEGFFEAVVTVADFHPSGHVIIADNAVQSHASLEIGAQYQVPGLQSGGKFAGKLLAQVAPFVAHIDLTTHPDCALFVGGEPANPVRGLAMGIRENAYEHTPADPPARDPHNPNPGEPPRDLDGVDMPANFDDDIPF